MSVFLQLSEHFLGGTVEPKRAPRFLDLLVAISKAQDFLKGKPLRSSLRVAAIAGTLAKRVGLSQRDVVSLLYAGLVYDIGLVRVAADLYRLLQRVERNEKDLFQIHALLNARVITNPFEGMPEVQQVLINHPQAAIEWVERLYLSEEVKAIVVAHHELCDGSGYPFGLTQEMIPFGARILAFADTVEAVMGDVAGLTSRKHTLESFLDIKVAEKFDLEVVEAFRALLDEGDDFFRKIYSLEVEAMARELAPDRQEPLDGKVMLDMCQVLSEMSDGLLPLYRKGHSQKVAYYAAKMAENLGINREQCGELIAAGLVHDAGMLAMPVGILMKQGQLTAEEWNLIYDHPRFTEEVLRGVPGFENIALWTSEHHERMNGRGYPSNKKGFEISVGGRILAIADVFDALTSSRPYRTHAHEPMDALPIMGQGRFSLYDNQLVSVLRKVILETEVSVAEPARKRAIR